MASSSCGSSRFPPPWSAEETDAFCFRGIRLRRLERHFPRDAMNMGLEPRFLGSLDHHFRFVNGAPSVIKLAKVRVGFR